MEGDRIQQIPEIDRRLGNRNDLKTGRCRRDTTILIFIAAHEHFRNSRTVSSAGGDKGVYFYRACFLQQGGLYFNMISIINQILTYGS